MTRVWILRTTSLLAASICLSAGIGASSGLGQEIEAPKVPAVPAVDPAPAIEPVKDAVKDAKDTAKEGVKDAKDAAQPLPDAVRDAACDAREGASDTVRDARDTVRDAREGARDTVRDAREGARDTVRDVRDTARDVRGSVGASANARANMRWQDLRSADLGLWFNGSANVNDGLVIADVATQGKIAKLGFQEGDRIVSVAGPNITRQADFIPYLYSSNVAGGRVPVVIVRAGKQQTIYMEPQLFLTNVNSDQSDPLEQIGIVTDDRVQDRAVVWKVIPRSPAFYAGLRGGDVILSLNKQPVATPQELAQLAAKAEPGELALEVQRGDRARLLQVDFQANTEVRSASRVDYDDAAPALDATAPAAPARFYYNNSYHPRRGLFRGRR